MGGGGRVPDLALCLQICLVPNQYNGEVVSVLDSEDLREELAHLIETAEEARRVRFSCSARVPPAPPPPCSSLSPLPIINGKHQQETMPGAHILLPHGAKLLLAGSVQDCRERERVAMWMGLPLAIPMRLQPCHGPPIHVLPPLLSSLAGTPSTEQIFV